MSDVREAIGVAIASLLLGGALILIGYWISDWIGKP